MWDWPWLCLSGPRLCFWVLVLALNVFLALVLPSTLAPVRRVLDCSMVQGLALLVSVALVLLLALAQFLLFLTLAPGFLVLAQLLARALPLVLPSALALARVVDLDPAPLLALALYLALLFARLTLGLLSALAQSCSH